MAFAEFDAYFSRSVAPTRRLAIGELRLPVDGKVDAAAMLLGGITAKFARLLDPDDLVDYLRLLDDIELGRRVPQPRLRYRFQYDQVGLRRSTHKLVRDDTDHFQLEFDREPATAEQQVLAAAYAARTLPAGQRKLVIESVRRGAGWAREIGPDLFGHLRLGVPNGVGPAGSLADPVAWALSVLGFGTVEGRPAHDDIRGAFRACLRRAHPDHGADVETAADRIAELDAARRILLG